MSKTIEIIITPEGRTTLQTLGFTGPSCQDASRFLEQALGQRIAERPTAEFYQAEVGSQLQSRQT